MSTNINTFMRLLRFSSENTKIQKYNLESINENNDGLEGNEGSHCANNKWKR